MKALNSYVLINAIAEEERKIDGIILTAELNETMRYAKGSVLSIGHMVPDGTLKENDIVYYDKRQGHEVEYRKSIFRVIRLQDIAFIDED